MSVSACSHWYPRYMFRRRKPKRDANSIEAAFEPFERLEMRHAALFEMFLLGGIHDALDTLQLSGYATEDDASRLFTVIPSAAGIATSASTELLSKVPMWDPAQVRGLTQLREQLHRAAPTIAANPSMLMVRLVPVLQRELVQYAVNRTAQARSSWVMMMSQLVLPAAPGGSSHEDSLRAFGAAVQKWETAAGLM